MSDYISKTLLLHDIAVVASMMDDPIKIYDQMSAIVKESPAADVVERKHGKWIYQFHEDEVGVTCSECEGYAESFARWVYDEGYRTDYNFCPNCGADMRGDSDV